MFSTIYRTMLKALFSVSVLFVWSRIMGKKHISQLTFFDYVVGISIGSLSGTFAMDDSIGYIKGVTGLSVYALFTIILSYISLKSYSGRRILNGTPTILIQNGRIIESGLKSTKMNINDLIEECRLKNAFNIADIEFAVLETSGKLSVLLKSYNQPLTPKDMNIATEYKGLCINLIIDGRVLDDQLKTADRSEDWLSSQLQVQGIKSPSEVLLAFIDSSNKLYVYKKESNSDLVH